MPPAVHVSGLAKRYGGVVALDGATWQASAGAVTAVLGPNGAGKTTMVECCEGLRRPDGGEVRVLGTDPWNASPEHRARVGVMLQDGGLPPSARPIPLLRHIAGMYQDPWPVDELIGRLGIDTFSRTNVRRLSGGQKQRLALAAALVGNPEVLFLDEPSAGLDPQSRQMVFDLISELRNSGMGIILTTHLMDDAQRLADYVYIIDAGRNVAEGTVAQLLRHQLPAGDASQHIRTLLFETEPGLDFAGVLPDGVDVTEARAGSYAVTGALTPADLAAITAWWAQRGIMPSSLSLEARSLEDVFLDISGREIR